MRHEFSRKTRRQAWERANGQCEGMVARLDADNNPEIYNGQVVLERCTAPIDLGRFEYDHEIPDWMGSDNSLSNCTVLCLPCHEAKTARDQGNIAKSKRIRDKQIKAKTSKRPMPFGRNSRYKRKIGGEVVPR
jgi:5-methylcytosine-specific restriction enzyme A